MPREQISVILLSGQARINHMAELVYAMDPGCSEPLRFSQFRFFTA